MNFEHWCQIDERIYIADSDERFKQYAGLDHSENTIEKLADLKNQNAKLFIDSFAEPRELYLSALESIADSTTKKLELKLYKVRNQKVVSSKYKFGGSAVNWSTWRQFNNAQKDDRKRKEVFDEFVKKTKHISPIIERRFDEIASAYRKNSNKKMTPLDGYLENEKLSYSQLVEFVKSLGRQARGPFQEALRNISRKVLGRDPDYYDDFYFFRNRVYSDFGNEFAGISPTDQVRRTLERLNFDQSNIRIDTENRKGKYPSPICFFVQVPTDIRVLYKSESPYFDLQGCYHEMGHAVHAASIDSNMEYWNRYGFSMGIAEIFSIFLERLTKNSKYLSSIGIRDKRALEEIEARNNFMELFFVTFYAANSLMKAEFWRRQLSMDKASDLYAKLIKEYTGFELPGEYWMLHHILPDATMYVPSYMLAAVRATELDHHLQERYGEDWWEQPDSGGRIREIMAPGAKIDLAGFSSMDSSIFMKEITGKI
jgi:oligoendopeptidase F